MIRFFASFLMFAVLSIATQASANEGMWVYNQPPLEMLKKKFGFEPTPDFLAHLMKSSVRFNSGGSGSFVSANGLVLTNHHVASDTLQKISTPQNNYYRNGFYAKTLAEEQPAKDLELNVLQSIEDVTGRVNEAVKPGMTPEQASIARRAIVAAIEKESFEKTGLRSDVVTLYQGGQYHLYRYKKYTDVRLVFAPEFSIAFFGGDPDNFEYPRYDLDMCLFRVYEDGKPVQIDNYLKWSEKGPVEKEMVIVSGHPGRTSRMFTVAAMQFLKQHAVPYTLSLLQRREALLLAYSAKGEEEARRAKNELFSVQNSRKVYNGLMKGLNEGAILAAKEKAEAELRAAVAGDPKLQELAGAWDLVAGAEVTAKQLFVRRALLETRHAFSSQLFNLARILVRMAEEDKKANDQRLPEYRESGRASLLQTLFSEAPLFADFEQVKLTDSLTYLVDKLGAADPIVRRILAGKSPAKRAAELVRNTQLFDPNVRKAIAKGGSPAITASRDSMIRLAAQIDEAARAVRKAYEDKVEEPERQGYGQIAKAMFAIYGTSVYPDATFTLRLAFGEVLGYEQDGKQIPPFTTLGGAFAHEAAHEAKEPWKLPESWHKAKNVMNLDTPYNFVSTNDIIGGNSGSPVVNRDGQLVGLIFDGNVFSLTADYAYSDKQARAVSVASNGMLEAMRKVYGTETLVTELLTGKAPERGTAGAACATEIGKK